MACTRPGAFAVSGSANVAISHSSPPMISAAATMRGSRRRAAASSENPKVAATRRISAKALLDAPSAMLAAIPLGPKI